MATMAIGMGLGAAGGLISALNSGPSSAMTALNNQVQDFSKYMTSQAKTEGIDATKVFQSLMTPLSRIVQGGPQQAGWSNAQTSAYNAQAVQRGAAAARDMGAFGNNNPGSQTAAMLQAKQKAEEGVSDTLAAGTIASAKAGQEEFNTAVGEEKALPGVFGTANEANAQAGSEQTNAMKSQQNIDTMKKSASWSGVLSKTLSGAGGAVMGKGPGGQSGGGLGSMIQNGTDNMSDDSSKLENIGNFAKGAFLGKGTMPSGSNGSGVPPTPGSPGGSGSNSGDFDFTPANGGY